MKPDEILEYCLKTLEDTVLSNSCGKRGIFYNPIRVMKLGIYVQTLITKEEYQQKKKEILKEL